MPHDAKQVAGRRRTSAADFIVSLLFLLTCLLLALSCSFPLNPSRLRRRFPSPPRSFVQRRCAAPGVMSSLVWLGSAAVVTAAAGWVGWILTTESAATYAVIQRHLDPAAPIPGCPGFRTGLPETASPAEAQAAIRRMFLNHGLDRPYQPTSSSPPSWVMHNDASFRALPTASLSVQHFLTAKHGTVSNRLMQQRLIDALSLGSAHAMETANAVRILRGDGGVMAHNALDAAAPSNVAVHEGVELHAAGRVSLKAATVPQVVREHMQGILKQAAVLARVCYGGFPRHTPIESGKRRTQVEEELQDFGRFAVEFESPVHRQAGVISFKLGSPSRHVCDVQSGELLSDVPLPLKHDASDFMQSRWSDEVDVEMTIALRGTTPLDMHDWFGANLRFLFRRTDTNDYLPVGLAVHRGFLDRHRRMFPLILNEVQLMQDTLESKSLRPHFRFAVAGHSQGGGLAQLTALALHHKFPGRPVHLFTFSSPPIFDADPLPDTPIRHLRFSISNDLVPMETRVMDRVLRRRHAGDTHITVDGRRAGVSFLEAHLLRGEPYQKILTAVAQLARPCPNCQTPIIKYYGHGCHHIAPGRGCPTCGTHFCFRCGTVRVRPYQSACACKIMCYDDNGGCGCPPCPECTSGRFCGHA